MADDLILNVDFDISEAEAKQRKLNAQWEKQKVKIENMKKSISDANGAIEDMKAQQAAATEKMKEANAEAERLKGIIDQMTSFEAPIEQWMEFGSIDNVQKEYEKNLQIIKECNELENKATFTIKKKEAEISKTNALLVYEQGNLDMIGAKIQKNTGEVEEQTETVEAQTEKVEHQGRSWKKVNQHLKNNRSALDKNLKRIKELAKSALIFSVLTKALTSMRDSVGEIFGKDKDISGQFSQLKNNLTVIMTTILQSLKPYITWILDKIIYMTEIIQGLLSRALGKSTDEMQKMANSMEDTAKAAKETKKAIAGFDTLQTAASGEDNNGSTNFDTAGDIKTKTDAELAKIGTVIGLALVGLGLILALTGVNIPLGLGMIVLGAATLYASLAPTWGTMSAETRKELQEILTIAGGLMLALGVILLCCGVIPLGIGMVVAGSAALATAYAVSPETFVSTVKNVLLKVESIMDEFVGWVLSNFYAEIFGKGFAKNIANYYKSFKNLWKDIFDLFNAIREGDWKKTWKSFMNVAIDIFNMVISAVNFPIKLLTGVWSKIINAVGLVLNKNWNVDLSFIGIPKIPRLATGAVIPGGKPFMAMLGDQRAGQTNIEAPLDTIVEAVKLAIGEPKFTVEAKGSWAQFIKMLSLEIKQEQNRSSVF